MTLLSDMKLLRPSPQFLGTLCLPIRPEAHLGSLLPLQAKAKQHLSNIDDSIPVCENKTS